MGPNPIGVNAQHTTCYGTVTRERKPALQYSHSLSKEPPMTPTFRENNAQGENMRKKKWRPSSTASVWPRTPLLAANSQPPLTPELATGPRKLLNSRRAIPHFRYRMLGARGRRVRNSFNEKNLTLMDEWWDRVDSTNTHIKQDAMFRHTQKPFSLCSAPCETIHPQTATPPPPPLILAPTPLLVREPPSNRLHMQRHFACTCHIHTP